LTSSGRETLRDTTTIHQFTTKEKLSFIQGGPVSWWRLDGNANDEIGNNDGTVLGGLSYINSGRFGKAASFDGIDDYIQVQDSPELQLTQNFAIVTWINPKDTNPHTIICKGLNAGTPNYILNSVSNQIDFYNGTAFISSNTGVITQNDWNHVAFVHDGTSYTFYVSGVEQGTGPIGTISASTNKTIIGEQCNVPPNTLTGQFNGTIDELMIFNSALTPEEIETLHTIDLS
ncbi:MAG: LamG domain-containing protein, partial [Candidatus Nanoarchaeia archaeon]